MMRSQFGRRRTAVAMVLTACLIAGLTISHVGAADFKPTPRQSIGYQTNANGWYPGPEEIVEIVLPPADIRYIHDVVLDVKP